MLRIVTHFMLLSWGSRVATFVLLAAALALPIVFYAATPNWPFPAEPNSNIPIPIHGVVTYNGRPVAGAVVSFLPIDKPGRHGAFGTTGPDGSLHLTTFDLGDGVLPGCYRVRVAKAALLAPDNTKRTQVTQDTPWPYPGQFGIMQSRQNYKSVLPSIYGDVSRTPLRCNVPAETPVVFDLKGDTTSGQAFTFP